MTIQDWAGLTVSLLTIISAIVLSIKWLVKHYLSELKINGGSSVKDQMNRLERTLEEQKIESERSRISHENKIDKMYEILLKHIDANNK